MPAIAAAHNIPYVATANPSYPYDLMEKVKKAQAMTGPAYIHVLSACPTGWRCPSEDTIAIGKLAVETGIFPLYEVINGQYVINRDFKELKPVNEYLKTQGRFRHLTPDVIEVIQNRVTSEWEKLKAKSIVAPAVQYKIIDEKCPGCGLCIKPCPQLAITPQGKRQPVILDQEKCIACGNCFAACKMGAIEVKKSPEVKSEII